MPKKKYRIYKEDNMLITELERGARYSVRVRLPPDDAHDKWWYSPSLKVNAPKKAVAVSEGLAYRERLLAEMSGESAAQEEPERPVTVGERARAYHVSRGGAALDGSKLLEVPLVSSLTIDRERLEVERIEKYFGDVALAELTADEVARRYDRMRRDGVSETTVFKCHKKLKQVLDAAFDDGEIPRNPARKVKVSDPGVDEGAKEERRITKKQATEFAQALLAEEKTGYSTAVWLGLMFGLRRGETLALSWRDVDLEAHTLSVRGQYGKEHKVIATKTQTSRRTISTDPASEAWLREWRGVQEAAFAKAGRQVGPATPVCTNEALERLNPDNFSRWRRKLYVRLGLACYTTEERWVDSRGIERVRRKGYVGPNFHSLRHLQATMMVAAGVDPKTVQKRLGHANITTTLQIYAESVDENEREAAQMVGGLLGLADAAGA